MIRRQFLTSLFIMAASCASAESTGNFQVYVSRNYTAAVPAGLIVYMSPIDTGEIPIEWKYTFDKQNLIWVSVDGSGNTASQEQRISEAKASLKFIDERYDLDNQRIYISGMSGGAQIAGIVAASYPELFNGGIFLCGVNPWSEREADPWIENPPDKLEKMKNNRYVFVSGTEDFKLAATARVYRKYKKAGIEASKLIVVDGMGHELPNAATYRRAIEFLDNNR
jgi:predicted esterase